MDYGYYERPTGGGRTRRVYAELLTDDLRAAMVPQDRAFCERLALQGHEVAVLYESNGEGGTIASLGAPKGLVEMTREQFVAAHDARWPDSPDVSASNAATLGGELGLKHIPAEH